MTIRFISIVLVCYGFAVSSKAAVIYSGLQNIAIPTTFDGVFLDIDNGVTSTSVITGWDINPFFGGVGIANSAAFQPARVGISNEDAVVRLNSGDTIGGSLIYSSGEGGSGDVGHEHLGLDTDQFAVGVSGYLGFKFTTNSSAGPYYGWMRLTFTNNTAGAEITDWAWDDTGGSILAGAGLAVPEPSRVIMVLGSLGILFCRRKRETWRDYAAIASATPLKK